MVLINEIGDYDEIKAALRGTLKAPPTWQIRPELRNRVISAFTVERSHRLEIERLVGEAREENVRGILARVFLEEEIHQAMIGSLLKPTVVPWQHVVGSELAFIALTGTLAQIEPDTRVGAVFDYLLIDHLTQVKALTEETKALGLDPAMVDEVARLPDGRDFKDQFHPTEDLIKTPYPATADPGTKVNVRLVTMADTLVGELTAGLGVMGAPESLAQLARVIGTVEAGHHLMLRTLLNPEESVLERAFQSELAEVMGLNRLLSTEKESGAKEAYDFMVEEDEDHLRYLGAVLADVEGKDPIKLSDSNVFGAKPRRTLENYLAETVEAA